MELLITGGVILGFSIFVVFTIRILFGSELDELRTKDKRYYRKKYLYHKKEAVKAYKKYLSLKRRDGGDSIKSRRR